MATKVLHLTVDHEGKMLLWPTGSDARKLKRQTERYVCLMLTPQQQASIENMRAVAEHFVKAQQEDDRCKQS